MEVKNWKKITQDSKDFEDSLKDKVAEIDPVLIKEFTIAEDKEFLTYNWELEKSNDFASLIWSTIFVVR